MDNPNEFRISIEIPVNVRATVNDLDVFNRFIRTRCWQTIKCTEHTNTNSTICILLTMFEGGWGGMKWTIFSAFFSSSIFGENSQTENVWREREGGMSLARATNNQIWNPRPDAIIRTRIKNTCARLLRTTHLVCITCNEQCIIRISTINVYLFPILPCLPKSRVNESCSCVC